MRDPQAWRGACVLVATMAIAGCGGSGGGQKPDADAAADAIHPDTRPGDGAQHPDATDVPASDVPASDVPASIDASDGPGDLAVEGAPAADGGGGDENSDIKGDTAADAAGDASDASANPMTCGGALGWGAAPFAAFSPDGSLVALASAPAHFELRRWADGTLLPISNGLYGVSAVAFSADGKLVAAAAFDAVKIWRLSDGAVTTTIAGLAGASQVALSADGSVVGATFYTTEQSDVRVWTQADPTHVRSLATANSFGGVAISPDGALLVATYLLNATTSNPQGHVQAWTVSTGVSAWDENQGYTQFGPGFAINGRLLFAPGGTTLAQGPLYPQAAGYLRRASDGMHAAMLGGASVTDQQPWAFSSDGTALLAVQQDRDAVILRTSDGAVARTFTTPTDDGAPRRLLGLGFAASLTARIVEAVPTVDQLALVENDATVRMLPAPGLDSDIASIAMSGDGRWVATSPAGSNAKPVRIWDTTTMTQIARVVFAGLVAITPDGKQLLHNNSTSLLGQPIAGAVAPTFNLDLGYTPLALAISPSGTQVLIGNTQQTAELRQTSDGTLVRTFWELSGHTAAVNAVAFSRDGTQVATGSADKTVKVWTTATGASTRTITGPTASVVAVAFNGDGSQVVSADQNNDLRLWTVATGAMVSMAHVTTGFLMDVKLSPDGAIAYVAAGPTLLRYQLPAWTPLSTLPGHHGLITQIAISADGKRVASGAGQFAANPADLDGTTRIDCLP